MPTTTRDDILARLDAGIDELCRSDRWAAWLTVQSRFHRYSFSNSLLIHLQFPGATRVAGYRAWQKLGRQVIKGERGLAILAPVVRRGQAADAGEAAHDGEEAPAAVRRVAAFIVTWVWDVSQTAGEPLPGVCTRLGGEDPHGSFHCLLGVAGLRGYRVEEADLPAGTNGDCSPDQRLIRLQRGLAPAMRFKTMAHELGHSVLHPDGYLGTPRALAELEAESVAFVVCQAIGIDSAEYSLGYVASWAGGGDEARAAL
ncbi:MAG: ArdC-like ssDNA-binding domain-containing protein, partial [Candidatus Dormibacteria bacterium]